MSRRRTALILLLSLGACAKPEKAVIFATADIDGAYWAAVPEGGKEPEGGFPALKRLYDAEPLPKTIVDLGNWFSGTPEGWLSKGASAVDCLNAVPYAAAAPGPADLSLSPSELEKALSRASFAPLASNLYAKTGKRPACLLQQKAVTAGKARLGFLAVTVGDAKKPGTPRYTRDYKFEKESYEMERALKNLREAGAKISVLLLSVNSKEELRKDFYSRFLQGVPKVDIVLTRHPGLRKPARVGRTWVLPAWGGTRAVSRAELEIDPSSGRLKDVSFSRRTVSPAEGEDAGMRAVVARHRKAAAAYFARRIATAAEPVPAAPGRDSPMGNWTADCIRRWARTDAALLDSADLKAGFPAGAVTVGDLYAAMPYDESVVFVKIRGEELRQALEENITRDLSVSGLSIETSEGRVTSVSAGGRPLAPDRIYRLAIPDSVVNGRDYNILSRALEFANSKRYLREILGWCAGRGGRITAPKDPRIAEKAE